VCAFVGTGDDVKTVEDDALRAIPRGQPSPRREREVNRDADDLRERRHGGGP
jgi:hypothetical protein